jgi:NADH-quinone oxidoreductase subunit E
MSSHHRKLDFQTLQYKGEEGALIPALQRAQEAEGYVSRGKIIEIHKASGIPLPHIYGVATFYSQFRLHPVGKHVIKICHGTACHVSGAKGITETIEDSLEICTGETTSDKLFTIETVSCLGCCSLAPVIMVDNSTFGNLDAAAVRKVVKQYRKLEQDAAAAGDGPDKGTVKP